MGIAKLHMPVLDVTGPTGTQSAIARQSTCAEIVSRRDLDQLAGPGGGAHVSLFAPVAARGLESAQNRIRWKTMLAGAEAALRDVEEPEQVDAVFETLRDLTPEHLFAANDTRGVAVFARPGRVRCFHLPVKVPELAAVGERFLVAPLLTVVRSDDRFLLLVLNRARVRLFRGTRFGLKEIPADDLPAGPSDPSVKHRRDVTDRPDAFLTGRGGSGTGVVFYGRGGIDQQRHEEILQYFRTVDAMLPDFADGRRPPVVLAGVGHLIPLYRQVARYHNLVDDALRIDPTRLSLDALHNLAWARAEPQFRNAEAAAARRYRDRSGTGWTLSEPGEVLAAAKLGRIDVLFLATSTFTRRTSDQPAALRLSDAPSSVADQLDQAVAYILAYGGTVYLVVAERMPDPDESAGSPAAALLRF